jgi:hypothetical protein
MQMAIAFKVWLNIDFEIQVHDCSEQPGDQIQNDDGVGETRAGHRAKPPEKEAALPSEARRLPTSDA